MWDWEFYFYILYVLGVRYLNLRADYIKHKITIWRVKCFLSKKVEREKNEKQ